MSPASPADLLPGAWVALLALLLAFVLRRWYDRVPPLVWAAFALALVALLGEVLLGGGVLLPVDNLRGSAPFTGLPPTEPHGNFLQGDLIQLITPSLARARGELESGRWPLWNPLAGAGVPLLADPQAQPLQPLVLLAWPFALERAAGITAALRLLLALVFTYLLLARQGLGLPAALAGALAYGLGGFVVLWLGWPLATSAALLPALLYALARAEERGGRRDALLLGAVGWSLLLAGHPETTLYALALGLAFLLARLRRRPREERGRRLAVPLGALALAAFAAAPVLLPSALYLPRTLRSARLAELATGDAPGPAVALPERLVRLWLPTAAPNAFGNSRYLHYWGHDNTNEDAAGFVGTAALLAVLLAIPAAFDARRRLPQERLMLLAVALSLVTMALPPACHHRLATLPLVGGAAAHGYHRLLMIVAFGLAYVAACSLERLARGQAGRPAAVVTALVLAGLLTWAYLAHPHPGDESTLEVLRLGWLRWQLRFLAAAVLLHLLAARPGLIPEHPRRWVPAAVALLIAAELLLAHRPANPAMPAELAFPLPPPLAFLRQHRAGDDRYRMAALDGALPPNLATLYGLADARVYNPMEPSAYARLTAPLGSRPRGEVPRFTAADHPLYDLLGVRYLLTAPGRAVPPPAKRVFAGGAGWVYERAGARPLLFPTGTAGHVAIGEVASHRLRARVTLAAPGVLASSIYQDGGWRPLVDGFRGRSATTATPFAAVALPAKGSEVVWIYRPPGFLAGALLAALAAAAALAWWLPPPAVHL